MLNNEEIIMVENSIGNHINDLISLVNKTDGGKLVINGTDIYGSVDCLELPNYLDDDFLDKNRDEITDRLMDAYCDSSLEFDGSVLTVA